MKGTRIASYKVRVFETPLKRPFVTALGRKTSTVNVGFDLRLSGGARGYGEASASLAMAHLKPAALAKTLRSLGAGALGKDAENAGDLAARAWRRHAAMKPACAAFEAALLEALAASRGLALSDLFGGAKRWLESDLTLSAVPPPEVEAAAREAAREGFGTLKVKLSGEARVDLDRARAARRGAPRARLLLDGNQGLTERGALALVEACLKEGMPVGLLEQPLPRGDLAGMARLTRRCPVPVAADESASTPAEALRVVEAGAAKVLNIKVAKTGLLGSLQVAALARAAGLELMIGCMSETARGLSASVHLALGTGAFAFVDLDSDHLLAGERGDCGWERRGARLSLG